MYGIGDALAASLTMFIIIVFGGGVLVGWLVFKGAPMLWEWLRPILHVLTA